MMNAFLSLYTPQQKEMGFYKMQTGLQLISIYLHAFYEVSGYSMKELCY